jgi:uncharacterized protein (TIGR00255 family)
MRPDYTGQRHKANVLTSVALSAGEKSMPRSMTGFARQEAQHTWGHLICEVRSVNHRYLEPSLKMSDSLRSLEPDVRDALRKRLGRGKVDVVLVFKVDDSKGLSTDFNQELAQALVSMAIQVGALAGNPAPLNALDILRWPGVMQTRELDQVELEEAARRLFSETLNQLIANREREGAELVSFIEQRLVNIAENVASVSARLPELMAQQQEKLRARLDALAVDVDQERLAQELVYLAQKSDVAEELDRLQAHLVEVRRTLKLDEPIGRRLDFLMQELNREANTLSSKSIASDTTQSAVDLKVLIEQMREQVQNIE